MVKVMAVLVSSRVKAPAAANPASSEIGRGGGPDPGIQTHRAATPPKR